MQDLSILPSLPVQEGIEFRHIPGWFGYAASSDGLIWTAKIRGGNDRRIPNRFGNAWKPKILGNHKGYRAVTLFQDKKPYRFEVHTLILLTFVGPCPLGMEACHYPDSTRSNNRIENLRWDTPAENMRDKCRDRLSFTTRICCRCKREVKVEEMRKDPRRPGGLSYHCIECGRKRANELARKRRREKANRKIIEAFSDERN